MGNFPNAGHPRTRVARIQNESHWFPAAAVPRTTRGASSCCAARRDRLIPTSVKRQRVLGAQKGACLDARPRMWSGWWPTMVAHPQGDHATQGELGTSWRGVCAHHRTSAARRGTRSSRAGRGMVWHHRGRPSRGLARPARPRSKFRRWRNPGGYAQERGLIRQASRRDLITGRGRDLSPALGYRVAVCHRAPSSRM